MIPWFFRRITFNWWAFLEKNLIILPWGCTQIILRLNWGLWVNKKSFESVREFVCREGVAEPRRYGNNDFLRCTQPAGQLFLMKISRKLTRNEAVIPLWGFCCVWTLGAYHLKVAFTHDHRRNTYFNGIVNVVRTLVDDLIFYHTWKLSANWNRTLLPCRNVSPKGTTQSRSQGEGGGPLSQIIMPHFAARKFSAYM